GISAALTRPTGIALGGDNALYLIDYGNNRIRRIDLASGVITLVAGGGTEQSPAYGGPAKNAMLSNVSALAVDAFGRIYLADRGGAALRVLNPSPDGFVTATLWGATTEKDCGVARVQGSSTAANLFKAMAVSLSNVCLHNILSIATKSSCSDPRGTQT